MLKVQVPTSVMKPFSGTHICEEALFTAQEAIRWQSLF